MNSSATGIYVGSGGMARILSDSVTGNLIGVDVEGGTALLQGNILSNNTNDGLKVGGGGIVDAGQKATGQVGTSVDFTGLGAAVGLPNGSTGGNTFLGYTGSGNYAIGNANIGTINSVNYGLQGTNDANPASPHFDVLAMNNIFGGASAFTTGTQAQIDTAIEQLVLDDHIAITRGLVRFDTNKPDVTAPIVNSVSAPATGNSLTFNVTIAGTDPSSAKNDPDELVSGIAG